MNWMYFVKASLSLGMGRIMRVWVQVGNSQNTALTKHDDGDGEGGREMAKFWIKCYLIWIQAW